MTTLKVNDKLRRVQYTAIPAQVYFTYDWEIFADSDLDVYKDQVLLNLNIDYTVSGAGLDGGGEIKILTPAVGGEEIVIVGDLALSQTTDYTFNANFTGNTIQTQFDRLTMIDQQLKTTQKELGLLYNVFTTIRPDGADNVLPQLGAGQYWRMNNLGTGITAVTIDENPDWSTLRSELASSQSGSDGARIVGYFSAITGQTTVKASLDYAEQILPSLASQAMGSDGASLVGYYDITDSSGKTVAAKLDELSINEESNFTNLVYGGNFTTNPFQRGDIFASPVPNNTWVADRFKWQQSGAATISSSAPTSGGPPIALTRSLSARHLELKVTGIAAIGPADYYHLVYGVEGYDWSQIAQRQFTLSFVVKATNPGIYSVFIQNIDLTISYVAEYKIDSALTWEKKSITVSASPSAGTWDYTNDTGIRVGWTLAAGANHQTATLDAWQSTSVSSSNAQVNGMQNVNDIFAIDKIQIEEGPVATSFYVRSYSEELSLLQRYYTKTYDLGTKPGTTTIVGVLRKIAQSPKQDPVIVNWQFSTRMRVAPALVGYNNASGSTVTPWQGLSTQTALKGYFFSQERGATLASDPGTPPVEGDEYLIHAIADAEVTL